MTFREQQAKAGFILLGLWLLYALLLRRSTAGSADTVTYWSFVAACFWVWRDHSAGHRGKGLAARFLAVWFGAVALASTIPLGVGPFVAIALAAGVGLFHWPSPVRMRFPQAAEPPATPATSAVQALGSTAPPAGGDRTPS